MMYGVVLTNHNTLNGISKKPDYHRFGKINTMNNVRCGALQRDSVSKCRSDIVTSFIHFLLR